MSSLTDQLKLPMPCPKCGEKTEKSLTDLSRDRSFVCSGCRVTVEMTGDDIRETKRAFDELESMLKKFGK